MSRKRDVYSADLCLLIFTRAFFAFSLCTMWPARMFPFPIREVQLAFRFTTFPATHTSLVAWQANAGTQAPIVMKLLCEGCFALPETAIITSPRRPLTSLLSSTCLAERYLILPVPLPLRKCIFKSDRVASNAPLTGHILLFDFLPVQFFTTRMLQ